MTESAEGIHFLMPEGVNPQKIENVHWTRKSTLQLLGLYEKYRNKVGTSEIKTFKQMWKFLSTLMKNSFDVNVSPEQCENRWRVLERTYKKCIENNSRMGRPCKHFDYEEEMGRIHEKSMGIDSEDLNALSNDSAGEITGYSKCSNTGNSNTHVTGRTNTSTNIIKSKMASQRRKQAILENIRRNKIRTHNEKLNIERQRLNIENERLEISKAKLVERKRRNDLIAERNKLLKIFVENNLPSKGISILQL